MNDRVIDDFPSPIAFFYQQSLDDESSWLERTWACNRLFEFGIRALVLGILSRYVQEDLAAIYHPSLIQLLQKMSETQLRYWVHVFNELMKAYYGVRERFFMHDLYDAYWDPDSDLIALMDQILDRHNHYAYYSQGKTEEINAEFYSETADTVEKFLEVFDFVAAYDLIHVTTIYDDKRYQYILYRGVTPQIKTEPLTERIAADMVYLRNQEGQFLPLNPFFVSYPMDFDDKKLRSLRDDIGLLNRYVRDDLAAIYNMPINQITEPTQKPVPMLKQLLEQVLQHASQTTPGSVFDWNTLRSAAEKISDHQMESTREKYDPDTYLNRQAIDDAFQDFLSKEQNAFVLLGKSGVGKSNFVIAEIGDKLTTGEQMTAILVNGGSLTLPDVMHFIFNETRTTLKVELEEYDGETFIDLLHSIVGDAGRQLLIVVDAINENDSPDVLMTWINRWALYAHQKKYYWLKFVVTSRPEAWRNIRRVKSIKINTAAYYRPVDKPELTFELKGFGVQMGEFDSRLELQEVYDLYAKKYGIVTQLESLPRPVRDNLRDPLILKLVMRTHGNDKNPNHPHEIPPNISSHTIIKDYIQDLRSEMIVLNTDFRLLVETLVPLMCEENRYRNYITRNDITLYSDELVDFIFTDDEIELRDGSIQQVNQSFQNLMNSEILILQRNGYEDEIRFKFERFYDYFVSEYMKSDFKDKEPEGRKSVYVDLANRLADTPYLWGPISNRLIQECVESNIVLLRELAWINDQDNYIQDLVIYVLIEFGEIDDQNNRVQVEQICLDILQEIESKSTTITDQEIQAGTIAIQVAHYLRLQSVLVQAMLSPFDFVLDGATDVLIELCRKTEVSQDGDLEFTVAIVQDVNNHVSIFRFSQFKKVARNLLILCLAVFFLEYKDREQNPRRWQIITQMLQETLMNILKKVPGLNLGRTLRRFIVRHFANFAIYLVAILSRRKGFNIDLSSITDFFKLSRDQRQEYRVFVDYVNSDNVEQMLTELDKPARELINDKQVVASYIMMLPLASALRMDSHAVNLFLTDLFKYAFKNISSTTSSDNLTGSVTLANYLIVMRNTIIEAERITPNRQELENFKHVFRNCEKMFWSRYATTAAEMKWMDIITYYYVADKMGIEPDFQLIRDVIVDRLKRPDVDKTLWHFIQQVIVLGFHPTICNPELVSELMLIILDELPDKYIKANSEIWIETLLIMRAAAEYHTDIFLNEADRLPESIKQAVRTGRPNFDIGGRVGTAGSWFVRDIMLDEDDTMRKYFQWFFYTALEAKDERDWLLPGMNAVIDGLFAGKFPDPDQLLAPYRNN